MLINHCSRSINRSIKCGTSLTTFRSWPRVSRRRSHEGGR